MANAEMKLLNETTNTNNGLHSRMIMLEVLQEFQTLRVQNTESILKRQATIRRIKNLKKKIFDLLALCKRLEAKNKTTIKTATVHKHLYEAPKKKINKKKRKPKVIVHGHDADRKLKPGDGAWNRIVVNKLEEVKSPLAKDKALVATTKDGKEVKVSPIKKVVKIETPLPAKKKKKKKKV